MSIIICTNYYGHITYGKNALFPHHNPLDNDEHYNYFVRCVDRFCKILISDERKLFIHTELFNEKYVDKNTLIEKFIQFDIFLKTHTKNYKILFIIVGEKNNLSSCEKIYENSNIIVYYQQRQSDTDGTQFLNDIDNENYRNIIMSFNYSNI
jgi:hypothetical protein